MYKEKNKKMLTENQKFINSGILKDRPLFEESLPLSVAIALPVIHEGESIDSGLMIINEASMGKEVIKEVISWALGAAAEYGLAATVVGAPAAPVAEAAVDSLFAAESISSALSTIKRITSSSGKFSAILNDLMGLKDKISSGDFNGFYKSVRSVIRIGLKILGEGSIKEIDKLAKELSEMVSDTIDNSLDSITKCLKLLVPDATLGASISLILKTAARKGAENFYTLMSGIFKLLGKYGKFLYDPNAAKEFFESTFEKIVDILLAVKEKIEDTSYFKTFLSTMGNPTATVFLKKVGPKGLQTAVDALEEKKSTLIEMIENIVSIVFPMTAALFATLQVLLKGEYKDKKESGKEKSPKEKSPEKETESTAIASESRNPSLLEAIFD